MLPKPNRLVPPILASPSSEAGSATVYQYRFVLISGVLVLVVGIAILYRFNPAGNSWYPQCWFRSHTGLLCPGCGCLRAAHSVLHGEWVAAWHLNPWIYFFWSQGGWSLGETLFRRKSPDWFLGFWTFPWTSPLIITALLLFGIFRNI